MGVENNYLSNFSTTNTLLRNLVRHSLETSPGSWKFKRLYCACLTFCLWGWRINIRSLLQVKQVCYTATWARTISWILNLGQIRLMEIHMLFHAPSWCPSHARVFSSRQYLRTLSQMSPAARRSDAPGTNAIFTISSNLALNIVAQSAQILSTHSTHSCYKTLLIWINLTSDRHGILYSHIFKGPAWLSTHR